MKNVNEMGNCITSMINSYTLTFAVTAVTLVTAALKWNRITDITGKNRHYDYSTYIKTDFSIRIFMHVKNQLPNTLHSEETVYDKWKLLNLFIFNTSTMNKKNNNRNYLNCVIKFMFV